MTNLRRHIITALVLLGLTVTSAVASGQDGGDFDRMLKAMDTVPTRAQLDARWTDATDRLMEAALDDSRDRYTRSRAITLLSLYPEPSVRKFLTTLADSDDVEVRRLAVYTVGRAFGSPGDAALVALVTRFTRDPAEKVRLHAVRALRWIDHADAEAALTGLTTSDDPIVAATARKALERRKRRLR